MDYPIKGFIETSFSDWPGKVVAVLFLPSCNFRCLYCHNHGLVVSPEQYPNFPLAEIVEKLRRRRGWTDGVCITGGEPTLHPWLPALIRRLKRAPGLVPPGASLGIKLDTNGTRPQVLRRLLAEGLLDYVALDLKAPLEAERYARITGIPLGEEGLACIRASIDILLRSRVDHEFRTTLVPAFIGEEEVYALAERVRGAKRYTLQNFNPRDPLDDTLKSAAPFDESILRRMQVRVNEIIEEKSNLSAWRYYSGQTS